MQPPHLHDYSVNFYKSLEAETGLNAGFSVVGNLRMAQTKARMDEFMLYGATAETVGVEYHRLTPNQIKERWPLIHTDDLEGAIYHPGDGYINPADVTMAMAKGARQRGVSIERKWQADGYPLDRLGMASHAYQDGGTGWQSGAVWKNRPSSPQNTW